LSPRSRCTNICKYVTIMKGAFPDKPHKKYITDEDEALLMVLMKNCDKRAETSSARLRQLGMQSTSGQVVERLGYLLGRPTPRLGTPRGIGMGGVSITPGKSETGPGGQPKATGKIGREQDRVGRKF
ncbi:MAG: hypothetical protein ACK5PF_08645, partial [bacterium]